MVEAPDGTLFLSLGDRGTGPARTETRNLSDHAGRIAGPAPVPKAPGGRATCGVLRSPLRGMWSIPGEPGRNGPGIISSAAASPISSPFIARFGPVAGAAPARAEERIAGPETRRVRDIAGAPGGTIWFLPVGQGAGVPPRAGAGG